MSKILSDYINQLFFKLRTKLAFSNPIKNIRNEDKSNLFSNINLIEEEKRIINQYKIDQFRNNSSIINYKENLFTLKLLEDCLKNVFSHKNIQELRILDIGSKNFSYAHALHNFFSYYKNSQSKRKIILDGIEIDAYRIMADLHSRYDYAQYYIKDLPNTNYLIKDFLKFNEHKYDYITWFLPFLTEKPLLKWGIPLKFLQPEKMMQHAYNFLNPQGIILVVNQLETEKNVQLEIINKLGLNYTVIEKPYTNAFSPFQYERYITLVTKA